MEWILTLLENEYYNLKELKLQNLKWEEENNIIFF